MMATKPKPKAKQKKQEKNKEPALGYFEAADAAAAARNAEFAAEAKASSDRIQAGVKSSVAAYAKKEQLVQEGVNEVLVKGKVVDKVAQKYEFEGVNEHFSPLTAGMQTIALSDQRDPLLSGIDVEIPVTVHILIFLPTLLQ